MAQQGGTFPPRAIKPPLIYASQSSPNPVSEKPPTASPSPPSSHDEKREPETVEPDWAVVDTPPGIDKYGQIEKKEGLERGGPKEWRSLRRFEVGWGERKVEVGRWNVCVRWEDRGGGGKYHGGEGDEGGGPERNGGDEKTSG